MHIDIFSSSFQLASGCTQLAADHELLILIISFQIYHTVEDC